MGCLGLRDVYGLKDPVLYINGLDATGFPTEVISIENVLVFFERIPESALVNIFSKDFSQTPFTFGIPVCFMEAWLLACTNLL